jgi:hypothetical protein
VAVLYGPGKYFLCRHCYDLTYQSQQDNKMYRAVHRAQDIRRRLGASANRMEPFPEKPKGMHWRTYERFWWEHHEAEMEQLVGMGEWIDKVEKKVGSPRLRVFVRQFWGRPVETGRRSPPSASAEPLLSTTRFDE